MKRFKMDKFGQIPMFQEPADVESRWERSVSIPDFDDHRDGMMMVEWRSL
jgi:hypothetical protein